MEVLAHVFLQVSAGDAHARDAAFELEFHATVERRGLVVLGDLVVLRHVRVEIILPVELGVAGDGAVEQEAGERRQPQRLLVGHRQHAGQTQAYRADVGIGRRAEFIGATAPHLRFRLKLDVGFQADDRFVFHTATRWLPRLWAKGNGLFREPAPRARGHSCPRQVPMFRLAELHEALTSATNRWQSRDQLPIAPPEPPRTLTAVPLIAYQRDLR